MSTGFPKASGLDNIREVLSRRGWLGILAFLAVAGFGTTVVVSLPEVYRSSATVLVQQSAAASAAGLEARLEVIREKMLSRPRLEKLVADFDLYPDLRKRLTADDVVEQMRRDIRLTFQRAEQPSGGGATVAFTVSHRGARDPETSAKVTSALAAFAVEEEARLRDEGAGASTGTLKPQLETIRARLIQQERRLASFRAQNPASGEADLALTALQRLGSQRDALMDQRARAQERRQELLRRLDSLDPGARPANDEERLQALRAELVELKRRFGDKYPDVIQIKQQIATLEEKSAREGAVSAGSGSRATELRQALAELDSEIQGLGSEESRLRGEYAESYRRLQSPGQQQALLEATRDYETTKTLYDSLLRQYEEAALVTEETAPARERPQLRVLDPAVPPKDPVAPNRPRLLLMTLLLALGTGIGAMVLAEHFDSTFHTHDDLRAFTRVPVLTSIPPIATKSDARRRALRLTLASVGSVAALFLLVLLTQHFAYGNESLALLLAGGS